MAALKIPSAVGARPPARTQRLMQPPRDESARDGREENIRQIAIKHGRRDHRKIVASRFGRFGVIGRRLSSSLMRADRRPVGRLSSGSVQTFREAIGSERLTRHEVCGRNGFGISLAGDRGNAFRLEWRAQVLA